MHGYNMYDKSGLLQTEKMKLGSLLRSLQSSPSTRPFTLQTSHMVLSSIQTWFEKIVSTLKS